MTDHAAQHADRRRFARIRWHLLKAMHGARANECGGWSTGRWLIATLEYCGRDYQVNDADALGLLQDLVCTGYALEEDNREDISQPFGLEHLTYKITGKGIGFMNRTEAPDALIDDGRLIKR